MPFVIRPGGKVVRGDSGAHALSGSQFASLTPVTSSQHTRQGMTRYVKVEQDSQDISDKAPTNKIYRRASSEQRPRTRFCHV